MQTLPTVQVFPDSGYRNTTFAFRTNIDGRKTIKLYRNNIPVSSSELDSESSLLYQRVTESGPYRIIVTGENGTRAENIFTVQDSVQIGSSIVKGSFLFPELNLVFIVKKDRTLIYDTVKNTEFIINGVSPSSVIFLNSEYLLFETLISSSRGAFNFGFFRISTLTVEKTFESMQKIRFDSAAKRLWVYQITEGFLAAVDLDVKSASDDFLFKLVGKLTLDVDHTDFVLIDNGNLNLVDTNAVKINQTFEKSPHLAISLKECIYLITEEEKLKVTTFFSAVTPVITLPEDFLIDLETDWKGISFLKQRMPAANQESLASEAKEMARRKVKDPQISPGQAIEFEYLPASGKVLRRTVYHFYRTGRNVYRTETKSETSFSGLVNATRSLYRSDDENILMYFNLVSASTKTVIVRHYKGLTFSFYPELHISDFSAIRSEDLQKAIIVLRHEAGTLCAVTDGNLAYETVDLTVHTEPSVVKIKNLGYYAVKSVSGGYTELYKLGQNQAIKLLDIRSKIYYDSYIRDFGLLWLRNTASHPRIYYEVYNIEAEKFVELEKLIPGSSPLDPGSRYIVDTSGKFEKGYFLTKDNVLVCLDPYGIKSAVAGRVIGHSGDLQMVLTYTDDGGYLLFHYHKEQERYLSLTISDPDLKYTEAKMVPNGQFALLRSDGKDGIQVFDIEQQKMVTFLTGKFLGFTNEGSVIIEQTMHRAIKIFDPGTFEDITPAQYHFYRHLSPDGKLFSQRSQKFGYYNFPERRELTKTEFDTFKADYEKQDGEEQHDFESRYSRNLAAANKRYEGYFNGSRYRFKRYEEIAKEVTLIEIGITGTDVIAHLPAARLNYYNYLSFSYDNKFAGFVGKPYGTGLFQLFKIKFDQTANTLEVLDYVTHNDPTLATWVCEFSRTGYFGTYDSRPNTFLVKVNDQLFTEKFTEDNTRRHTMRLDGKSFECFSPEGNYLALSEKGYEPMSLGGRGHMNSRDLYIAETESAAIVKHFSEHGDYVKFAAFSEDGNRLLSASNDGVVIIRDIDLNGYGS